MSNITATSISKAFEDFSRPVSTLQTLALAIDNRFSPYIAMVQADPHAAYVSPASSPLAGAFAAKAASEDG